jgi:hypothetical protein
MNMRQIRLFAGASLLLVCSFAQNRPRPIATLRLQVTDSHGLVLDDWEITKLVDADGRDWKESVSPTGIARIPPGEYSLGVDSAADFPFEGFVSVRAPTTYFTAGLLFAGIVNDAGANDVFGRFEVPPGEDSWCKLSGLYTGRGHFSPVGADGKFRFVLVPSETYALICWRGSRTLALRTIDAAAASDSNPEIVIPAQTQSPSRQ